MRLINLTPHDVNVALNDGRMITIPRSGRVIRVGEVTKPDGDVNGIPIVHKDYESVDAEIHELLADPDTVVIVSLPVQMAIRHLDESIRRRVLSPDTGPDSAIRDANGQIVAVRRLQWM